MSAPALSCHESTLGSMAHRKNHVASKCYLARWTGPDGRLRVVSPPSTESKLATPKSVGYRVDFWGRDAKVRRAVEEALGRVESDVANSLRKVVSHFTARARLQKERRLTRERRVGSLYLHPPRHIQEAGIPVGHAKPSRRALNVHEIPARAASSTSAATQANRAPSMIAVLPPPPQRPHPCPCRRIRGY